MIQTLTSQPLMESCSSYALRGRFSAGCARHDGTAGKTQRPDCVHLNKSKLSAVYFLSHIWYITTTSTNQSGCALISAHLPYQKTVHHHSDKSTKLWPWGRFTSRALKMPALHSTHSAARSSAQSLMWNPNSKKGIDKLLCRYPTGWNKRFLTTNRGSYLF